MLRGESVEKAAGIKGRVAEFSQNGCTDRAWDVITGMGGKRNSHVLRPNDTTIQNLCLRRCAALDMDSIFIVRIIQLLFGLIRCPPVEAES